MPSGPSNPWIMRRAALPGRPARPFSSTGHCPGGRGLRPCFRRKPTTNSLIWWGCSNNRPSASRHAAPLWNLWRCAMQHVDPAAQVAAKQRVLEDSLWHIGRLARRKCCRPFRGAVGLSPPGPPGVRKVPSKGGMLIGFHERRSSYIADLHFLRHPAPHRFPTSWCPCAISSLPCRWPIARPRSRWRWASAVRRWYSVFSRR